MPDRPGSTRHALFLFPCLVLLAGCGGCDDEPAPTPSAEPTSPAPAGPLIPSQLQALLAALADSPSPHLRGFAGLLLRDLDAGWPPSKQALRTLERLYPRLVPDGASVSAEEWRRRSALAQGQLEALVAADTGLPHWRNLGQGAFPGRMTAIELSGTGPQRVAWAGAANGGVWRLVDGVWSPKTDPAPTLNVGALAVDPDDPDVVYVGTGEGNYFADHYTGFGLFRLDDPGVPADPVTFTLIADTNLDFHDLVFAPRPSPAAPKVLWAATTGGLFRYDVASSSWSRVVSLPEADTTAVLFAPGDPLTVFAGIWGTSTADSGIHLSIDGGTTWSLMDLPSALTAAQRGRVALAACSPPAKRVYALLATPSGGLAGVLRRDAEGADAGKWVDVTGKGLEPGPDQRYHLALACDAGDPETAYVGLQSVFRRAAADGTWAAVAVDKYHQDLHELLSPAAGELWAASDGGVYASLDRGDHWAAAGSALETTQYYHYAVDPLAPAGGIGGTQDRGAIQVAPAQSSLLMTGDIFFTAIHPTTAAARCFDTGQGTFATLAGLGALTRPAALASEPGGLRRPLVFDRAAPARLLTAAQTVHRAADPLTAAGATFASIAGTALTAGFYSALETSAGNPDVIYAGTSTGEACSNANGTWACTSLAAGRVVTSASVHPADPLIAFATLGGAGPGHVWKTTDGGQKWDDVSPEDPGGSPIDIHFSHVLVLDPPERVAAAADVGVYLSSDGGQTWDAAGTGLPNAPVSWLGFAPPAALRAATFGRGLWEVTIAGLAPPATPAPSPTP